jgi:hypothetical protein
MFLTEIVFAAAGFKEIILEVVSILGAVNEVAKGAVSVATVLVAVVKWVSSGKFKAVTP